MQSHGETLVVIVRFIDKYIGELSGKVFCWLILPLIFSLTYEVILRYLFDSPTIWAYDLSYMLYGAHFMLGATYALYTKGHIRTDMLYEKWSVKTQGRVDTIMYILLFFPGIYLFSQSSLFEALQSVAIRETSDLTPWRPIIYPFKLVIPLSGILLLIQGISELLKSYYAARNGRWL